MASPHGSLSSPETGKLVAIHLLLLASHNLVLFYFTLVFFVLVGLYLLFKNPLTITVVVSRKELKNACIQYFLFNWKSFSSCFLKKNVMPVFFIIHVIYLYNNMHIIYK